jgi:two-component system chemotaxis response regulator CheB
VAAPIRVLVVDDSALMRKMVTEMLSQSDEIEVIGQARDGADALNKLETLRPDVITLDVEMPVMDGLAALEEIMRRRPTPVVMLSSLTQAGAETTLTCLDRGAVDFVAKPGKSISLNITSVTKELTQKVIAAARAKIASPRPIPLVRALPAAMKTPVRPGTVSGGVLLIGASTGGPRALQTVVPALPGDLGVPVVLVQHMPAGFTRSLAQRLDALSPLCVREAEAGDVLTPGQVLIAPGGHHLTFHASGAAVLTDEPPVHGVRPAVDVTLASLIGLYGRKVVAVLLTGMGRDGARGCKTLHDLGGSTLAEDESTCVIYGMPRAAWELGGVGRMLPLPELAAAAAECVMQRSERRKIHDQ